MSELTACEQRVLGCLIEKRWTTPDQYPLTLNALRLACNQATNRDPVTAYDEPTVREAAQRLCKYGVARLASGHSSRATKYRHLAEEALGLDRAELAVLSVLLLRGAQTPGELKSRSERMTPIESLEHVELVLESLAAHGYARRLTRRPGQKEDRYVQLLGAESDDGSAPGPPATHSPAPTPAPARVTAPPAGLVERVAALETEIAKLRQELARLRHGDRSRSQGEPEGGSGGEREPDEVGRAADDHAG
ncbi:MAG: DUF480 domain-containing protein [Actinomycetota bacterium]|nr:DUF480 domain-containing protein [Actinomycetota bacterium]